MVKKLLFGVIISMAFVLFSFAQYYESVSAQEANISEEKIDNYNILMRVEKNGDLFVSERIDYNFGQLQRHGIYRDIPLTLTHDKKKSKLKITDIAVTDESGNLAPFTIDKTRQNLQIKIGDADVFITGKQSYIIDYLVKKPFVFMPGSDRLSWNAVGSFWKVPIENATVEIKVDSELNSALQNVDCYVGSWGSTQPCNVTESGLLYKVSNLESYSGVTVDLDFKKGTIPPPTREEIFFAALKKWWGVIIPILVFIFLYRHWSRHGRDPKGRGTIITQFDAPDKISSAEVGVVLDERANNKDIWSSLIDLAIRGYLKITRLEKNGVLSSEDYLLERKKGIEGLQNEFEILLLQSLFKKQTETPSLQSLKKVFQKKSQETVEELVESVKLSDLKYKFASDLTSIKMSLYKEVVQKGYFPKNPETTKGIYLGIGIFALVITVFCTGFFISFDYIVLFISLIFSCCLILIFSPLMSRRTPKGVLAKEHILGLKSYLNVAEKDRINFHNAPEKNPATFEKYLPFAMALGVEKEWAKQFEDLSLNNFSWYSSSAGSNVSSIALVSSLSSFSTAANQTLNATYSSGGGGGSVGGGGGGGGGGSW